MLCVYVHRPMFIYLFMLKSFMVLHILQLRTLYKTMFIPEMTFYRKPDSNSKAAQQQLCLMFTERQLHSGQTQH